MRHLPWWAKKSPKLAVKKIPIRKAYGKGSRKAYGRAHHSFGLKAYKGAAGTLQINHLCEKILRSQANFDIRKYFFKKIVMIGVNDYPRGLFNGDTGIVHEEKRIVKAGFKDSTGNVRQFRYLDLPAHDTGFAVTIHKSQGSEFDTVLIIIPDKLSPIVTRQLLYTGVTRARKKAIIVGRLDVIKEAMTLTHDKSSPIGVLLEQRLCRIK